MSEPIEWLPDGTPYSPRFSDRYHSESGGRDQARRTFFAGCGLPQAWADQSQWRILETGFGLGLNFLTTWAAWQADPQRPRMLHFVSVEAYPVPADDLLRTVPPDDALRPLAEQLAAQWWGLLPGVHRLSFEQGQVLLTMYIGDAQNMLRKQQLTADSVFLDGFSPKLNPELWSLDTLKAVSRHCRRGTRVATWCVAGEVRERLKQLGFEVHKVPGIPPKRHNLQAIFNPPWQPKRRGEGLSAPLAAPLTQRHCLVLGAGLAGAAAAASLARRGWQVTVLDAADQPATGASGLPAGLFCPHVSPDDSLLSRLSRSGVRTSLQTLQSLSAQNLLQPGQDWQHSGVLEHDLQQPAAVPPAWLQADSTARAGLDWSAPATAAQLQQAGLGKEHQAVWHQRAGWVRPQQLVQALLRQPGVQWRGAAAVHRLQAQPAELASSDSGSASHHDGAPNASKDTSKNSAPNSAAPPIWQAVDAQGTVLASAPLVVLALGPATAAVLQASGLAAGQWELQAIRGQVSVANHNTQTLAAMPAFPVNGNGNLVPDFPASNGARQWVMGSTFERDISTLPPAPQEQAQAHASNAAKLADLLPACRVALADFFDQQAHGNPPPATWSRVRVAAYDRIPVMGPLHTAPDCQTGDERGLWTLTGLGSRGLTLSLLCAELLAAQLHDEPLPLDARLATALGTQRMQARLQRQAR